MSAKIRTVDDLLSALDGAFGWRVQELSVIRGLMAKSTGKNLSAIIRAGIPILYAHWEGFVKQAAIHFADYISCQRLTFGDIAVSFSGLRAHHYVMSIADVKKMVFTPSSLLTSIRGIEEDRVNIALRPFLDNVGNLSYGLFQEVAEFLSLSPDMYVAFKPLIDESLLASRNKIAHGEHLIIDEAGYEILVQDTLTLMTMFKSDLENLVVSKSYLR